MVSARGARVLLERPTPRCAYACLVPKSRTGPSARLSGQGLRAVDVYNNLAYRIAGNSVEAGKYFFPTLEQAETFGAKWGASQITSAVFPQAAVDAAYVFEPAGEGIAYLIPAEFFPFGPVIFL